MHVAADELIGGAVGQALYELLRQRLVKEVPVAQPAAGAEWSQAVPAGVAWEVLSVAEVLVASAVVANRSPSVQAVDPNGTGALRIPAGVTAAAGSTNRISFAAGYGDHLNSGAFSAGLPDPPIFVPAGWSLSSLTSALDVGDQYSAVILIVREWSIPGVQAGLDYLTEQLR